MTGALEVVYSLPFVGGAVFGAGAMKLYQWQHCRAFDRAHPLPDGAKHKVPGISQQFWGGLLAIAVLGYVLLQVGQTEARYQQLAARVEKCNARLIEAQNARAEITTKNDALSVEQRDLLTAIDAAEDQWTQRIFMPPPHIADLPLSDGRRAGYPLTITRLYSEQAAPLRKRVAEIRDEQSRLSAERALRELPSPSCDDQP